MFNFLKKDNSYQGLLYKEYGKSNKFNKEIKILFISDTHNALYGKEKEFSELSKKDYDICILLGDHSNSDIDIILKYIPLDKIYGILGNHDTFTLYENYNIKTLHNTIIEINGVRIAGFQGAFKYTSKDKPLYTHEESLNILNNLGSSDIFVTHDKPFIIDNNDPPHDGLKGITNYIYMNNVPFHIHGHLHNNDKIILKNKCISYCVYPFKLIKFDSNGIEKY